VALLGVVLAVAAQAAPPRLARQQQRQTGSMPAQPAPARQPDARLGRDKADAERCFECHGEHGLGAGQMEVFAKLAGQRPDYLILQFEHFLANRRDNESMFMKARTVDAQDLQDIAAYFAALPPMRGDASALNARGEQLLNQGDAALGIPACSACHGPQAQGTGAQPTPVLAGQDAFYLKRQLWSFRDGSRRETGPALMGPIARQLSDADISALVRHLSSL